MGETRRLRRRLATVPLCDIASEEDRAKDGPRGAKPSGLRLTVEGVHLFALSDLSSLFVSPPSFPLLLILTLGGLEFSQQHLQTASLDIAVRPDGCGVCLVSHPHEKTDRGSGDAWK